MNKKSIKSAEDIESFFNAFNRHDWDIALSYMSSDCVWNATEKCLKGRQEILDYWTNEHAAFRETLGKPEKIVFGDNMVYLQVNIHLDFTGEGIFYEKSYRKGDTLEFTCADFYELNDEGKIKSGHVYVKFLDPSK